MIASADTARTTPASTTTESAGGDPTAEVARPVLPPLVLHMRPALEMDDEQFFAFCQQNRELQIERNAEGDLIIMSPVGGETGDLESELGFQLRLWAKQNRLGVPFSPSTGFILPNGAERSPDAAWVLRERLAALAPQQKKRFLPLCPDFVAEFRSPSDPLSSLQEKMQEWIDNGARLGWLIDPESRRVYVYRPNAPVHILEDPATMDGDPELPGFVLDAQAVFDASF